MHKILIIEDHEDLAKGIEIHLKKEGYLSVKAKTGEEGIQLALKENPDLILLDIMLPEMSGLDVCRELRTKGLKTPIIMLTAKTEEIDRVLGLELGADDYVTKPFSVRELQARIRARLRNQPAQSHAGISKYCFGRVEIDFERFLVTVADEPVELTTKEFDVMRFLIQHRGEVVTRQKMLEDVWGYDAFPTTRTVDNHILKLRKKLEEDPANPIFILSAYGEGYRFIG